MTDVENATAMQKLIDGLTENAIAFIVVIPCVYMYIKQIPVPDAYIGFVGAVMGYYFTKGVTR